MEFIEFFEKMFRQEHDIGSAVVEGWQMDREDVEPIVEVFAEFAFLHEFFEVAACCCNEADVDFDFVVASDS